MAVLSPVVVTRVRYEVHGRCKEAWFAAKYAEYAEQGPNAARLKAQADFNDLPKLEVPRAVIHRSETFDVAKVVAKTAQRTGVRQVGVLEIQTDKDIAGKTVGKSRRAWRDWT